MDNFNEPELPLEAIEEVDAFLWWVEPIPPVFPLMVGWLPVLTLTGPGGAAKTEVVEVAGAEGALLAGGPDPVAPNAPGTNGFFNLSGGSVESDESKLMVEGRRSNPGNIFFGFGPSFRKGDGPLVIGEPLPLDAGLCVLLNAIL